MDDNKKITYADAGVDVNRGYQSVAKIKAHAASTFNKNVLQGLGSFGGFYSLDGENGDVLVAGTDGVGTKLKYAFCRAQRHCRHRLRGDVRQRHRLSGRKAAVVFGLHSDGTDKPRRGGGRRQGRCRRLQPSGLRACRRRNGGNAVHVRRGRIRPRGLFGRHSQARQNNQRANNHARLRACGACVERASLQRILACAQAVGRGRGKIGRGQVARQIVARRNTHAHAHICQKRACARGGVRYFGTCQHHGRRVYRKYPAYIPRRRGLQSGRQVLPAPRHFSLLAEKSRLSDAELYNTFNMGIGMVAAVRADAADSFVKRANAIGEKAYIIGETVSGNGVIL